MPSRDIWADQQTGMQRGARGAPSAVGPSAGAACASMEERLRPAWPASREGRPLAFWWPSAAAGPSMASAGASPRLMLRWRCWWSCEHPARVSTRAPSCQGRRRAPCGRRLVRPANAQAPGLWHVRARGRHNVALKQPAQRLAAHSAGHAQSRSPSCASAGAAWCEAATCKHQHLRDVDVQVGQVVADALGLDLLAPPHELQEAEQHLLIVLLLCQLPLWHPAASRQRHSVPEQRVRCAPQGLCPALPCPALPRPAPPQAPCCWACTLALDLGGQDAPAQSNLAGVQYGQHRSRVQQAQETLQQQVLAHLAAATWR